MAELERNYIIPLRKALLNTARWKKARRAVSEVKIFLKKHMKAKEVKIGKELNQEIWKHGGKKVPSKVNVFAKKEDEKVFANLSGLEIEKKEKPKKSKEKEDKKSKKEKSEEKKEKSEEKSKEDSKKESKKKEEKTNKKSSD